LTLGIGFDYYNTCITEERLDIQKLVADGLENNRIRELYLYKVPLMKNVEDWNRVKEVGKISFKGKHANYNGGLVEYAGNIYFITENVINALIRYRKWNFTRKIEVITEEEWKSKVTEFQGKYKDSNKKQIKHL